MNDRNFDGLAGRFKQQIYDTPKGQLRLAMLQQDFATHLAPWLHNPCDILDAGGGQGQFAALLAAKGHHITLCDLSADMLALAKQQLPGAGHHFIHSAIQDLPTHLPKQFPIVLNHAVLEWVEDGTGLIQNLHDMLQIGGVLSLMFYNFHAITWRNLMNGTFNRALEGEYRNENNALMPNHPRKPEQVKVWLEEKGFEIISWRGIRGVYDHMPRDMRKLKTLEQLIEVENHFGTEPPYRDLGRYVHMLAVKR
jgi:S-adenosylmethionine-dependent methyltransferase